MNKNKDITILVACIAASGLIIADAIKTHRTEKIKRQAIQANLVHDLACISIAAERVNDRVARGEFTSIVQLNFDFEFELIIAHNE